MFKSEGEPGSRDEKEGGGVARGKKKETGGIDDAKFEGMEGGLSTVDRRVRVQRRVAYSRATGRNTP